MKTSIEFITILILMGFAVAGIAQNPNAQVEPAPLEVRGDSVIFEAHIMVPPEDVLKQPGTYVIMPELGEFKFEFARLKSSEHGGIGANGIDVTHRFSHPFREDMIGNYLEIEHEYHYGDDKDKEFGDMDDLAACCITTGMLYMLNPQYEELLVTRTPGTSSPQKMVVQFNYPLDRYNLNATRGDEVIQSIGNFLKDKPDARIEIRGYASPEGPESRNQTLAQQRATNAKNWLTRNLREEGFGKYFNENQISVQTTVEDWKGFKQLVSNSNLPSQQRQRINQMVDDNTVANEDEIFDVAGGEDAMEPYLKPLRRATVMVRSSTRVDNAAIDSTSSWYLNKELDQRQSNEIFNSGENLALSQDTRASAGDISMAVAYYSSSPASTQTESRTIAAHMVDANKFDIVGGDDALVGIGFNRDDWDIDSEVDLDEQKIKVKYKVKQEEVDGVDYKTKFTSDLDDAEREFMQEYENDNGNFAAANNLGAIYIARANADEARPYLQRSYMQNKNSAAANYNLGLYYILKGNFEKAASHFDKASDVDGVEYNRGLVHLINGNTADAIDDLRTFTNDNPDIAAGYYLLAIAGARTGNLNMVVENIEKAIQINPILGDVAEEDLEFRHYHDNDRFEEATNTPLE